MVFRALPRDSANAPLTNQVLPNVVLGIPTQGWRALPNNLLANQITPNEPLAN